MREYHKINSIFKRDERDRFLDEYSDSVFEYLKDNIWTWYEKIDGTNIRIMWDGNKIQIGGRTDNAQIPIFLLRRLEDIFTSEKFIGLPSLCLYGEGFGSRIQKGGGNYGDPDFILFDVLIDSWWLRRSGVEEIAETLDIKVVSIVGCGTLDQAIKLCQDKFNSSFGDFIAEGLVLHPQVQLFNRMGERVITKIKCRDFR